MIPDTTASWSPAERAAFAKQRQSRNLAIGLLLAALVVLFFGISVVKMGPGIAENQARAAAADAAKSVGQTRP